MSIIKNIQAQLCNQFHIPTLMQECLAACEIQLLRRRHLVHPLGYPSHPHEAGCYDKGSTGDLHLSDVAAGSKMEYPIYLRLHQMSVFKQLNSLQRGNRRESYQQLIMLSTDDQNLSLIKKDFKKKLSAKEKG